MTLLFELDRVVVHFGTTTVLRDISLRIEAGERVALVGPSGAGKSTLLSLLNGTVAPSAGRVRVLGEELGGLSARRLRAVQRRIGTIYQHFHLVDSLRVVHNVNAGHLGRWPFFKAALSLFRPLEVEQAAAALARVGIPEKLYARTDTLSGGQLQRVALARVLVQDPRAILADEPISQLDPERSREIFVLLTELSQSTGKTLVVSLHAIELARAYSYRIVGLRGGAVLFDVPAPAVTPGMIEQLYRIEKVA